MQYNLYQKAWNWKEREVKRREMTRVQYVKCKRRNTIGERVLEQERRKILCSKYRTEKKKPQQNQGVVVCFIERKVQQSSAQTEVPRSIAKKKNKQRNIRRMFKMLREVQLNIRVEKVNIHERVTVKVLLDSGITEVFMDRKMITKHGFRL